MPSLKIERKIRHNRHICHEPSEINGRGVTGAACGLSRHLSRTARMVLWLLKRDRWRDGWVTDAGTQASRDKGSAMRKKIASWAACDRCDANLPDLSEATLKLEGCRPGSMPGGGA